MMDSTKLNQRSSCSPDQVVIMGNLLVEKFTILVVALCIVLLFSIESKGETITILAFGDSITQGYKRDRSGDEWGIISPPFGARVGGYEPYLEGEFSSHALTRKYTVYVHNWGEHGERTDAGTGRIQGILMYHVSYDYCLIMEGANDLYDGISPSTTAFNLGVMIDACRRAAVTPILSTITPNTNVNYGDQIGASYNPEVIKIAESKSVILVDQYSAVNPEWSQLTSGDGLHLNSVGDQVMAREWYAGLMQDERFIPPAPPAPAAPVLPGVTLLLLGK